MKPDLERRTVHGFVSPETENQGSGGPSGKVGAGDPMPLSERLAGGGTSLPDVMAPSDGNANIPVAAVRRGVRPVQLLLLSQSTLQSPPLPSQLLLTHP